MNIAIVAADPVTPKSSLFIDVKKVFVHTNHVSMELATYPMDL